MTTPASLVSGKLYPFTVKPTVRGDYEYVGRNWTSAIPEYAQFDGCDWATKGGVNDLWYYTETPKPYRHRFYDEVPKPDLATRLAHFKETKASQN